ncbi:uncharacterized protein LY89DRAFT_782161 [Mollisia scopiformis]|uniref:Uncharacterized protein n=1 Tax=Mollisia scopiformis TaxID=149040 RepID=A0A194X9S3_MOLSC|nr:uncharacterized protein LY89DRAFT_782161 [Mollisia scopiformis]KUJ16918.1 hypothetical protein LY89DRAFT_782161 [Mollisia scopiformis]
MADTHNHVPDHICMMEGPDPELSISTSQFDDLRDDLRRADDEISRLQALLRENNIDYRRVHRPSQSESLDNSQDSELEVGEKLPDLPQEIMFQILGYSLTSSTTLTDPFYKGRKSNMTPEEQFARKKINVNFLATSKVFRDEGKALILKNNDIVFTQVAALANFAKIPAALRVKIDHVTLRVVGRYYGDKAKKEFNMQEESRYHALVPKFKIPLLARPKGMIKEHGIHAYCYMQVGDFLKALFVPRRISNGRQYKLLPSLKTMRMDLINFSDHLVLGRTYFTPIIRWHLNKFLDELLVTGGSLGGEEDEEMYVLRNLVSNGGLFSENGAVFISVPGGLKPLPPYGITHELVRSEEVPMKSFQKYHPEGGTPPKSHPERKTVFKWAADSLSERKRWIEFDYLTGEELTPDWNDIESEIDSEDMYDESEDEGDGSDFDHGSYDSSSSNHLLGTDDFYAGSDDGFESAVETLEPIFKSQVVVDETTD